MNKLFEENFYTVSASDNRQYMLGAGIQVLDIKIKSFVDLPTRDKHTPFCFVGHLKLPLWYVVVQAYNKIIENFDINPKKKLYGRIEFWENGSVVLSGKSDIFFKYIEYLNDKHPDLLYKGLAINYKEYPAFDKNGNYNTINSI
jgi:hypothetical protein